MRTLKIALFSLVLFSIISCKPSQQSIDTENNTVNSELSSGQSQPTAHDKHQPIAEPDGGCSSSDMLDEQIIQDQPVQLGNVFSSACEIE